MQEALVRVELEGVRKSYGRRRVLKGVDLAVERGEIVGLLGPNGSGKTTTLRIISGFLAPDAGRVQVCGVEMGPSARSARARIGYLPERPPVYDALGVRQYLEFVAAAKGLRGQERGRVVAAALEDYALGGVERQMIGRLSKGFRQRVGLAQATLGMPAVLLLDEPTSGLDPVQIVEARDLIERDSAGRAVIFSTHIMQEAAALCSRVVVMHEGRVLTVDRPANDPVAAQRVEIELGDVEGPDASTFLGSVPGVDSVRMLPPLEPDTVRFLVTAQPGEDVRDRLVRAAIARASLRALSLRRPSLEDRFVESIAAARSAAD